MSEHVLTVSRVVNAASFAPPAMLPTQILAPALLANVSHLGHAGAVENRRRLIVHDLPAVAASAPPRRSGSVAAIPTMLRLERATALASHFIPRVRR